MKKKIIAAIVTATLLIAGCSDMANVSAGQDKYDGIGRRLAGLRYLCGQRHRRHVSGVSAEWYRMYRYAQCRRDTEDLAGRGIGKESFKGGNVRG